MHLRNDRDEHHSLASRSSQNARSPSVSAMKHTDCVSYPTPRLGQAHCLGPPCHACLAVPTLSSHPVLCCELPPLQIHTNMPIGTSPPPPCSSISPHCWMLLSPHFISAAILPQRSLPSNSPNVASHHRLPAATVIGSCLILLFLAKCIFVTYI